MSEGTFQYDVQFTNNILIVRHTRCGKTTFVQNLAKNKIFGEIKMTEWMSKIKVSEKRKERIRKCFEGTKVEFYYPEDFSGFNLLIEHFQREDIVSDNDLDKNILGEKKRFNRLIVMDDISGLPDRSNDFSSFLTISRKFGYICLSVINIIFPNKLTWQIILSQKKFFSIFSSAIQLSNMLKILTNNCDRETINYIPSKDLWINGL